MAAEENNKASEEDNRVAIFNNSVVSNILGIISNDILVFVTKKVRSIFKKY
jgi:hypothetical protein